MDYSIDSKFLGKALLDFSRASGINFIYRDKKVNQVRSEALYGRYSLLKALDILLEGTGYQHEFIDHKTIHIVAVKKEASRGEGEEDAEDGSLAGFLEEIISLGTRTRGRESVTESPVPIDVFDRSLLARQSFGNISDALQTFVPALTVFPFPSADGSALVRPPIFRGLPQDQILVLVNGKRRHRSALVNLIGAGFDPLSQGSQGADMATIPAIAVKRIEVLRDGASAQYGSDAISGVMNFVLRDNDEGLELRTQYGQYYAGDGEDVQIQANLGLPLTSDGFINFSMEYSNSAPTSRGRQRTDVQDLIDLGLDIPDPAQRWGNSDIESVNTFWNGEIETSGNSRFYFFGNFSHKDSRTSFFYRHPLNSGVYKQSEFEPGYNLRDRFPNGFTPEFGAKLVDFSQVLGLNGETGAGLYWDASIQYGRNEIRYKIDNTVNLSLGSASPTSFRPGDLVQKEYGLNLGLSFPWYINGLNTPLNVAMGFEYRHEEYSIKAGEKSSYEAGPLKDLPIGSNGFPGFSPDQAGDFGRHNIALYLDLETNVTDRLLVNLAGRFEDYSDTVLTLDGKIAMRYEIRSDFAVRGALSTGFRAPTPGQSHTANTSTFFEANNPDAIVRGTLPPDHPASVFYGGTALSPETSKNITAGFIWAPTDRHTLTVDYYRIKIRDRIGISTNFTVEDADRAFLETLGVRDASTISTIRYFTNSFNTFTEGVDIVGAYDIKWPAGTTVFSLGFNYNEQKLEDFDPTAIEQEREIELQGGFPKFRSILSASHSINDINLFVRATYYDSFTDATPTIGKAAHIGSEWVFDVEASYKFNELFELSLGGRNIFNNFPDETDQFLSFGLPYSFQSPFGFNGGFWYLRAAATF